MGQQPFWAHILYGACQSWPQGLTPMRPLTAGKKTNHHRLLWSSQGEKRSPTASENMCSVFVKHYENQRIYHDFSIKKAFFVVQLWWENYLLTGTWNLNVNTLEEKWNQKMMVAFFWLFMWLKRSYKKILSECSCSLLTFIKSIECKRASVCVSVHTYPFQSFRSEKPIFWSEPPRQPIFSEIVNNKPLIKKIMI